MARFFICALFCLVQAILIYADTVEVSLYPNDKIIFIGEKTIVNTTIRFLKPIYEDVNVTLYPTMDGPDMYLRRILGVSIGKNLQVSGNVVPLMDWGKKDAVPGEYLACKYSLGTVKRAPRPRSRIDDVITFQYEAIMGAEGSYEDGDDHILGASVKSADDYAITLKHATMRSRTLPLLFRAMNEDAKLKPSVLEMLMSEVNGTAAQ